MKELEKGIASVVGTVGACVSYLVDGLGLAVAVLLLVMAIDYATGLLAGAYNKSLNSRIGFNGIIRKIYYLLLVAAVYALELVIPIAEFAGDGVAIAFIMLEFISITENGVKMNAPIPAFVKELLLTVKSKTGGGN